MQAEKNRVVLITGASSGIGAALARCWAKKGVHLVLLARRLDRLDALAEELTSPEQKILALSCDVTKDGQLEKAVSAILRELGRIDVVIANAGFGVVGEVAHLELADYRRQFETNVFGVLRTIKATLEPLQKSQGRLAIMGSVAGFVSLPVASPYAMSKFAVRALADSLWKELRPHGISVTHIAPGFISSEIRQVDNSGVRHNQTADPIPTWIRVPADQAARSMVRAILRRRREVVITGHGKAIVFCGRYCRWLLDLAIRLIGIQSRSEPSGDPSTAQPQR